MIPRLDFDVQLVELPVIPEKEIEGFLSYRIRSLYPGHREETAFDYHLLEREGRRYAVLFLTRRDVLEQLRTAAENLPLFSPLSLLLPALSAPRAGANHLGLFWHDGWLEILVSAKGQSPRTLARKRGADPAADLAQVLALASADLADCDCLLICPQQERAALEELLAARLPADARLTVRSSQETLRHLGRGPEPLFQARQARFPVPRSLRLQLAGALVLLLLLLALLRSVDQDKKQLASLRQRMLAEQGLSAQVHALEQEIEGLEARWTAAQARRPPDPYRVLTALSSVLGSGARINSFVLERGSFQLEAVGANPLRLMERFQARQVAFRNVKLLQIVPLPNTDRELFRIAGQVNAE